MASRQSTIDYILDQISSAGAVSARKMFGEYGIYCDGKIVALVCDNQLFVKPTTAGQGFVGICNDVSPYPGAKPCLLISEEKWDDREWLTRLVQLSASELPIPRKSRPQKRI